MWREISKDPLFWAEDVVKTEIKRIKNTELAENLLCLLSSTTIGLVGFPQVGKTTILLRLLGIKKNLESSLCSLLRAGRKKGNSSTSTATRYGRSQNEFFSIDIVGYSGESISKWQGNTSEFEDELISLRMKIEGIHQKSIACTYILIPSEYFENTLQANPDIVDFPGFNSSSRNEAIHVETLMKYWLPKLGRLIYVFRIDAITEALHHEIPGLGCYMKNKSKIMPFATYTFSNSSNCELLKQLTSNTSADNWFADFKQLKILEIGETLGNPVVKNSNLFQDFHFVECGESWEKFCTKEPKLGYLLEEKILHEFKFAIQTCNKRKSLQKNVEQLFSFCISELEQLKLTHIQVKSELAEISKKKILFEERVLRDNQAEITFAQDALECFQEFQDLHINNINSKIETCFQHYYQFSSLSNLSIQKTNESFTNLQMAISETLPQLQKILRTLLHLNILNNSISSNNYVSELLKETNDKNLEIQEFSKSFENHLDNASKWYQFADTDLKLAFEECIDEINPTINWINKFKKTFSEISDEIKEHLTNKITQAKTKLKAEKQKGLKQFESLYSADLQNLTDNQEDLLESIQELNHFEEESIRNLKEAKASNIAMVQAEI